MLDQLIIGCTVVVSLLTIFGLVAFMSWNDTREYLARLKHQEMVELVDALNSLTSGVSVAVADAVSGAVAKAVGDVAGGVAMVVRESINPTRDTDTRDASRDTYTLEQIQAAMSEMSGVSDLVRGRVQTLDPDVADGTVDQSDPTDRDLWLSNPREGAIITDAPFDAPGRVDMGIPDLAFKYPPTSPLPSSTPPPSSTH